MKNRFEKVWNGWVHSAEGLCAGRTGITRSG